MSVNMQFFIAGLFGALLYIIFSALKAHPKDSLDSFIGYFRKHPLAIFASYLTYGLTMFAWYANGLDSAVSWIAGIFFLTYDGQFFTQGKFNFLAIGVGFVSHVVANMLYMKLTDYHTKQLEGGAIDSTKV